MGHQTKTDPVKPTLIGSPLHPVEGEDVRIVEGALGNPVLVNDDDLFQSESPDGFGKDFYILVAAEKGQTARGAAENLKKDHRLSIRPFVPQGGERNPDDSAFEMIVDPEKSFPYLDPQVRGALRFRPDLAHLRALYGEKADYFMVAVKLPNDREALFGKEFRTVPDETGKIAGNRNVRKFDLIQESADGLVEVMRRGGFVLFDRQDPGGNPDTLYGVTLADLHLAEQNDKMEAALLNPGKKRKEEAEGLYLRFNNANADFDEAIIPWLNEECLAGRLDWVQILGDSVDYVGQDKKTPGSLEDSNFNLLADFLDRIEASVFVLLGNHDVLPQAFPAQLTAENFNLGKKEVKKLLPKKTGNTLKSIIEDPSTSIAYYDLINPVHDFVVNFGAGDAEDPKSREARFIFTDMGGADWAHFRQDDPVYRELQFWPFHTPYLHGTTFLETLSRQSPDVRGPLPTQVSWLAEELAKESHAVLLSHAPLVNGKDNQTPYDSERKIASLEKTGENEDLTFNTAAHGSQLLQIIVDNPNIRLHLAGHTHYDGNAYAFGVDDQNRPQFYRGPIRETLERIDGSNLADVRHFWFPEDPCTGACSPETDQLTGETADELKNRKFAWQVGSAGVYNNVDKKKGRLPPVFTRMSLNPEGLVSGEEHFYVVKKIGQDPENPDRHFVRLEVDSEPLHNDRLTKEWEDNKKNNPRATLDLEENRQRLEARSNPQETAYISNPDSLNIYPSYDDRVVHPYISPTRLNPHLRLRGFGGWPSLGWPKEELKVHHLLFGGSGQYLFSEDQIGTVPRLLIQGGEVGVIDKVIDNQHRVKMYAAVQLPPLSIDWPFSDSLIVRALTLSLGGGLQVYPDAGFYFHNQLNLLELQFGNHDLEKGVNFYMGFDRHDLFSTDGEVFFYTGLDWRH